MKLRNLQKGYIVRPFIRTYPMKPILLSILMTAFLSSFWGCKGDEAPPDAIGTYYDDHPEFNNVRKAITLSDGATVYVGSYFNSLNEQVPAVLILESDFSFRNFVSLNLYADGDLFNVIERSNGNIVAVGQSSSSAVNASPSNLNGFFVELDQNGNNPIVRNLSGHENNLYNSQSWSWVKKNQADALTCVYETGNNELVMGGIFQFDGLPIMARNNGNKASIFPSPLLGAGVSMYPNSVMSGYNDSMIFTGRISIGNACYSQILDPNARIQEGPPDYDFYPTRVVDNTPVTNWTDAAPISNPFIRSEILEGNGTDCYVFTLGSIDPYSIGITRLPLNRIEFEKLASYHGLGQAVFQNSGTIGNDFLVMGSTLPASADFSEEAYSAYIAAVKSSDGAVLWEADIPVDGQAVTAMTALERNDHIQVSGLVLDKQDNARFVQWKLDKDGNLME